MKVLYLCKGATAQIPVGLAFIKGNIDVIPTSSPSDKLVQDADLIITGAPASDTVCKQLNGYKGTPVIYLYRNKIDHLVLESLDTSKGVVVLQEEDIRLVPLIREIESRRACNQGR